MCRLRKKGDRKPWPFPRRPKLSQKQENGMAVVRLRESAKPNKGKVIRIVGRQNVESV